MTRDMDQGRPVSRRLSAVLSMVSLVLLSCSGPESDPDRQLDADWKPTRAIEFIAPANPGGGWDTLVRTSARAIAAEKLAEQSFVAINMPGGGGAVAWAKVARDRANAHRLFATSPPIILVPLTSQSRFKYTDFTPIARLSTDYIVVLVRADSDYQSIGDLLDDLALDPEKLSFAGGSAAGSMDHVAIAGIAQSRGLDPKSVNYISFSGGGEAIVNLIGGHVDVAVVAVAEALGQLAGGRVKALGVSSGNRIDVLPNVPTFRDQGIDYEFDVWRGVMAAGDLPIPIRQYYERIFAEMVNSTAWKEASSQLGWITTYQDSEEFGRFLSEQNSQFREVLGKLGMLRD